MNKTIHSLEFGKLIINDKQSKNDIELKANQKANADESALGFRLVLMPQQFLHLLLMAYNQNISHYSIDWLNPLPNEEFCIHIGGDQQWFSTYEENEQRWPIDKNKHMSSPVAYSTNDHFHNPIGGIIEYLFLGSHGFAIFIERSAPLFIRRDTISENQLLCFSGDYSKFPFDHAPHKNQIKIVIHLMASNDTKSVYRYAANNWIQKPTGIPDERMSTWAKYHADITQQKVLDFAQEIKSHGFSNSQIEIDDKWEAKYGDFSFDTKKFPNPREMVTKLKDNGYRVTLWVYPFINADCDVFNKESQYLIKTQNNSIAVKDWWNGKGGHIDFTNKKAQQWFISRLQHIRDTTGIDSFKFDAGELGWISADFKFNDPVIDETPVTLTQLYAETAAQLGNMIETRVGCKTQHLPIFVRMLDKLSIWDYNGGLKTLIPTALMMSIGGYSFVLPDMIGGNAYGNFPSKELYIRWLQLYIRWLQVNTLMPTIQFSITPWDFKESSQEVIDISKSMLKLHEQFTPLIIELAKNSVKTGEPIMRPIWWIAPNDPKAFLIDDQFLVGNDLLVAPVTTDKARKRDIYLPSGEWKDQRGVVHTGPQTLTDFKADLNELPYFARNN
ncbi:unnamed protein product [Medioppia subpectinata]|uniref:Uncharacterized protein n=1 Tax=Medioppia subpectinata TaxID=1979941 RepID=A0A7R9Q1I0_9ACAR|nr:unnamed protein product [Medioppia subpectinata]CAG2109246.1 unnamed protein product [Medioppia subpectinata]